MICTTSCRKQPNKETTMLDLPGTKIRREHNINSVIRTINLQLNKQRNPNHLQQS